MSAVVHTRRGGLLAAAGLLGGCSTIEDFFSTRKTPLTGERIAVIQSGGELSVEPSLSGRTVALPPAAPVPDWPVPGGTPDHAAPHAALRPDALREAWRASVGDGSGYRQRITAGPVASADTVFAADAFGNVTAFDLASGGRRWRRDTRPERDGLGGVGAGCTLGGDTLYVATGAAEVLALEVATGAVRWRAAIPAPTRGAPAVAGGRIHVLTLENHLLTLSAEDGRRLWAHRGQAVTAIPLGLPAPAVAGEVVVAGFPSGELIALRAADGRVAWTEALSAPPGSRRGGIADVTGVRALPVVSDGRVVAVGQGGTTLAVDLRSGRRLWERDVGGAETPAVAGDWVFLVSAGQELVAMGRDTGLVKWITALNPPAPPGGRRPTPANWGAPVLAGGRVLVFGSSGEAVAVDPDSGAVASRLRLPGAVTLPPAMAGSTVLALADDGTLVALRG